MNNWYVITGGPSSGKTTLITELKKLGHKTIPEAARTIIDSALANGISIEELRSDEERFQHDIVRLKKETENANNKNTLTFLDRGVQDTVAYMRYYNFDVDAQLVTLINKSSYKKVFLLEPLPVFEKDYARTEGKEFADKIHKLIHEVYRESSMEPILVPNVSIKERVKIILSNVDREEKNP